MKIEIYITLIIGLLIGLVFLNSCENPNSNPADNFSYSVFTDSSTYILGSTVTITCAITNESTHQVTQGYSGDISSLFYCEVWKDNEKVWNTQQVYPTVYLETVFESKETKDYTHYWVETSTSGSYTIKFQSVSEDIVIQEGNIRIYETITPEEANTLIQNNLGNENFVIIDIRTPGEYSVEHIENAINIDYYSQSFNDDLSQLDKSNIYLIYCASGNRSSNALTIMENLNFEEVYEISGGLPNWVQQGYPVVQ